jgi:hypothetical protein
VPDQPRQTCHLAVTLPRRYSIAMTTEPPKKPDSLLKLNPARIVLLILGAILLVYIIAAFSGSLTNYELVKEGAQDITAQQQAPAPATPAN